MAYGAICRFEPPIITALASGKLAGSPHSDCTRTRTLLWVMAGRSPNCQYTCPLLPKYWPPFEAETKLLP